MEATAVIRSQGTEYFIVWGCIRLVETVHADSRLSSLPFEYQWEILDRCETFSFAVLNW